MSNIREERFNWALNLLYDKESNLHLKATVIVDIIEKVDTLARKEEREEIKNKITKYHDEKCCTHEHCEYNCHAKGWNEHLEFSLSVIRSGERQ